MAASTPSSATAIGKPAFLAPSELFGRVEQNCRNHRDSVDWHSDNEPQLGKHPFIASVSLGEQRLFLLRQKPRVLLCSLSLHPEMLCCRRIETLWPHALSPSLPQRLFLLNQAIFMCGSVVVN